MLNLPIMILIKEPENLTKVLRLLLEQLAKDVELSPLDLIIPVQIKSLKKFLFDFFTVQVLEVIGIGGGLDISSTFLNHLQN